MLELAPLFLTQVRLCLRTSLAVNDLAMFLTFCCILPTGGELLNHTKASLWLTSSQCTLGALWTVHVSILSECSPFLLFLVPCFLSACVCKKGMGCPWKWADRVIWGDAKQDWRVDVALGVVRAQGRGLEDLLVALLPKRKRETKGGQTFSFSFQRANILVWYTDTQWWKDTQACQVIQ